MFLRNFYSNPGNVTVVCRACLCDVEISVFRRNLCLSFRSFQFRVLGTVRSLNILCNSNYSYKDNVCTRYQRHLSIYLGTDSSTAIETNCYWYYMMSRISFFCVLLLRGCDRSCVCVTGMRLFVRLSSSFVSGFSN